LTRRRVDLLHGTLTVVEQLFEADAVVHLGPPKTGAGRRVVHLPPHLLPELEAHLDQWVGVAPDSWLFCGPKGAPLARSNFTHHWSAARREAGVSDVHVHDLRHRGGTLAAATGATTKELMARMGHSSPRAALIYQHAAADRDQAIAEALSALVQPVQPLQLPRPGRPAVRRGTRPGQLGL
jgi:integrase